jgi:hypothetical protein
MDDEGIVTSGGDSVAIDATLYGLGKLYGAYAATRSREFLNTIEPFWRTKMLSAT